MNLSPDTFTTLAGIIRRESGIILGPEKSYLVRHRLAPLIASEKLQDFDALARLLATRASARLSNALIDAITVKETRFFRDAACFDALRDHVLPACADLLGKQGKGRSRIRFWSAATATGQEAWSLAMLLNEFAASSEEAPSESHFTILATDISAGALETAKSGRYTPSQVHVGLSDARLHQHFRKHGTHLQVADPLRRLVQFRIFNLLDSPAHLGQFDLILCRNVLIYFDDATRRRICQGLYAALVPGGWLSLGSAESLYGLEDRLETIIHGKAILYRKHS